MREADAPLPHPFRRGPRGTVDIVADILHICRSWRNKTGVMYQANLSHQMLKFYMWHVVELGLLEESDQMKFKITQKGSDFLEHYQHLAEALTAQEKIHDSIFEASEEPSRLPGKQAGPARS